MIVLVDYGMGNLSSIANMLRKVGADVTISGDAAQIRKASRLILPGVGAFDHGIGRLNSSNLRSTLDDLVLCKKIPVLGICLGMQLMTKRSDEGVLDGLGWIDAETLRFSFPLSEKTLKVPHMRWNEVNAVDPELFPGLPTEAPRFYFVHSYYVVCKNPADVLCRTVHGHSFVSAFRHENIMGVQFHPEKSHRFGMRFFEKWVQLV